MARGKSINMYLMDGDVNGRIKCTLANWTGLLLKFLEPLLICVRTEMS
ncbi:MAG: hypothetical protein PHT76_02640 [Anaerostipes sp.]|nr:hypothetical protein [Anaerostipes sp.]